MEILHQVCLIAIICVSKFLILPTSYCVFLAFEVFFVYFLFPETSGRSLEELAFCTPIFLPLRDIQLTL